jgi:ornithine carbamoyltransferase
MEEWDIMFAFSWLQMVKPNEVHKDIQYYQLCRQLKHFINQPTTFTHCLPVTLCNHHFIVQQVYKSNLPNIQLRHHLDNLPAMPATKAAILHSIVQDLPAQPVED